MRTATSRAATVPRGRAYLERDLIEKARNLARLVEDDYRCMSDMAFAMTVEQALNAADALEEARHAA